MTKKFISMSCISALVAAGLACASIAHPNGELDTPGFRPKSAGAAAFLERLDASRIAVLPTVIRTKEKTLYSEASQSAVVDFLKKNKLGEPEARKVDLDIGELEGRSQFDWFKSDGKALGKMVQSETGADYYLALAYLIPKTRSGELFVFGLHVYVLDADGESAFSFLLNSHHKMLNEAGLKTVESEENGPEALALKGDGVALKALKEQIAQARSNSAK